MSFITRGDLSQECRMVEGMLFFLPNTINVIQLLRDIDLTYSVVGPGTSRALDKLPLASSSLIRLAMSAVKMGTFAILP